MQSLIIRTKLQIPPTRSGILTRRRLQQQLAQNEIVKLTLISAPAGYGKTTLLSKWASDQSQPIAWLSLDQDDNDPVRFFTYLVSACQTVDHTLGQAALSMLQTPTMSLTNSSPNPDGDPFQAPLVSLIDDMLWQPEPLTIVLDDYHLIQSEPIHQIVRFLIAHQPGHMRLIICTRAEPPLNLSRLRAKSQLVEIDERDLRFTPNETTEFLQNLQLSPEMMAILAQRTEGWPAGLQLAALSLSAYDDAETFIHSFSGDDRQIYDYLLDEVLAQQPADVQTFLLHTSILSRLNRSLCDAVLAGTELKASSQTYLEALDSSQLFLVPLDNKREWYRYHQLFADFLQSRLQNKYPDVLFDLHSRASHWYESVADVSSAVTHAFQMPDNGRVIYLLEQHASLLIYSGQLTTYLGWLERLPQEVVFQHPYLCADGGWAYALSGQVDRAEQYALAGKTALPTMEPFYVALREQMITPDEVLGDLLSIQAFCARIRGNSAAVMRYSEEALQQLPPNAFTVRGVLALNLGLEYFQKWHWEAANQAFAESYQMTLKSGENIYVAIVALALQGSIHVHLGELDQAILFYQQAVALGEERAISDSSGIPATCMGYRGLAEIHYHRHELAEAAALLETAVTLAQQTGNVDMEQNIVRLQTAVAIQAGDIVQAEKQFTQAAQMMQTAATKEKHPDVIALQCELLLAQEPPQAAVDYLAKQQLTLASLRQSQTDLSALLPQVPLYLWLVQALISNQEQAKAAQLLTVLQPLVEAGQERITRIRLHLLTAVLQAEMDNGRGSQQSLSEATRLAEPAGFVSPFLSVGQPLYTLLRQMNLTKNLSSAFTQKVLAAFAGQSRTEASITGSVSPLTRQETQVLLLLNQGLSSTEVAHELVIAVSTARSYIKNIYRKLDVHSRDEALARANDLRLI